MELQEDESTSLFNKPCLQLEFKVVLLGDCNVGKTALVQWYTDKVAGSTEATVGTSVHFKQVTFEGRDVMLAVWDTAGQEKYASLGRIHSRNADAVLICYDITSRQSFDNVENWLRLEALPDEVFVVLVGCKSDISHFREVTTKEGVAKAKSLRQDGVSFYETSAFSDSNVDEVFEFVLRHLVSMEKKIDSETIKIGSTSQAVTKKNGSCKC